MLLPPASTSPAPIPVLGRRWDLSAFGDREDFRTCQGRSWSLPGNLAFLESIRRGPLRLASGLPTRWAGVEARNFFEWECGWRGLHGLQAWCPPALRPWATPGDPFLRHLASDPVGGHRRLAERARAGSAEMPELGPVLARMAWLAQVFDPALAQEGFALLAGGVPYRATLRFALAWTQALDALVRASRPGLAVEFAPKVLAEFEPLLAGFPEVVAFPTFEPIRRDLLLRLRCVPVHPLGLILAPRFTDGGLRSPLEFFLHDLDHARYKLREDLVRAGFPIPDPYQAGPGHTHPTTRLDSRGDRHRMILDHATEAMRARRHRPRRDEGAHSEFGGRLRRALVVLPWELRAAALELLFEIVHEKSLPFSPAVIPAEARRPAHAEKLRAKFAAGFHGPLPPGLEAALEAGQHLLAALATARVP